MKKIEFHRLLPFLVVFSIVNGLIEVTNSGLKWLLQ